MLESLAAFNVVTQALVATTATYLLTAVGTLPVLFFRSAPRRLMDAMMGFAAGVMVAASCWSLLVPAIERGGVMQASIGLLLGGAFLYIADQLLPHLHAEFPNEAIAEGPRVAWRRSALLMLAMTLHNFPEGLAVGVSFGGRDLVPRRRLRSASACRTSPRAWPSPFPSGTAVCRGAAHSSGDSSPPSWNRRPVSSARLLF
jgi:ZIP family zinc transporter